MIKQISHVIDGIISLTELCFESVLKVLPQKHDHEYHAEFGRESDHLSRFNHGIAVTGNKAITKAQAHTNVALFGPTGSGKSTIVIISSAISLARGKSSIIFNDVSGEVYDRTSSYLAKKGYSRKYRKLSPHSLDFGILFLILRQNLLCLINLCFGYCQLTRIVFFIFDEAEL